MCDLVDVCWVVLCCVWCVLCVQVASASDALNTFSLVPNDVTHIVYDTGGFFKPHSDYLRCGVGGCWWTCGGVGVPVRCLLGWECGGCQSHWQKRALWSLAGAWCHRTLLLHGGLSTACTHLPLTCVGSLTSNIVEEYTMLVCVTPPSGLPTAGGETRVTLSPGECAVDVWLGPGAVWWAMVPPRCCVVLCCCASGRSLQ